jgi:hypothetical protein
MSEVTPDSYTTAELAARRAEGDLVHFVDPVRAQGPHPEAVALSWATGEPSRPGLVLLVCEQGGRAPWASEFAAITEDRARFDAWEQVQLACPECATWLHA